MCYLYIIQNSKGRYYIGSTNNLDRRMNQHLSGHTHTTRRMHGLKLVFFQKFPSLSYARNIELRLKKLKRKDYIEKIIKEGYIKLSPP